MRWSYSKTISRDVHIAALRRFFMLHLPYMTYVFIFILGILAGIATVFIMRRKRDAESAATQTQVKEERLTDLLRLFAERKRITNDDVEQELGVSDATATRYLDELEKRGEIQQVGTTGAGVYYEKRG